MEVSFHQGPEHSRGQGVAGHAPERAASHGNKPARSDGQSSEPAVTVTLSLTAEEVLSAEKDGQQAELPEYTGPGKSVAHRARQLLGLEEFAGLRDMPFGKIVSTLARGEDLASLLPTDTETTAEIGQTTATADATQVGDTATVSETSSAPATTETVSTADSTVDSAADSTAETALSLLQSGNTVSETI